MSSSVPANIPYMLELIAKNLFSKMDFSKVDFKAIVVEGKPMPLPNLKILDVGCGFGKWGFLIRDTFEVMTGQNFNKEDWKIDVTGIEVFPKCITSIQEALYDKIIRKDVFESFDELERYDLILIGDMIEHIDKDKAHELLSKLFEYSDNILVSTPLGFMSQGAWAGNEYEIHKSGWILEDFKDYKVVESKVLDDTLFADIIKQIPDIPEEMKQSIQLLVLWLKK
jgi:SAM-dependent methyltransferase